ncbi:uncharacterized protein [Narcine bancroftii]|uniref:uncharacterized protein n=1 Tax=Narcine bancroftii TaxID=1343680 RepID=UPI003831AB90
MEVMLSGYGASCLPPGTADLVSRLPPRSQPAGRPWAPLLPMRKGAPANSCCWRRGIVSPADNAGRRLESTQGRVCTAGEVVSEDGDCSATAQIEGCPALRAPATEGAGGGSCHGAGHHTETGGESHDGTGSHMEAGGGFHDRAGPYTEAGGGSHNGAGPHMEPGGGTHDRAGPCTVAGGRSCHGADSHMEVEDRFCHGAGHTEEGGGSPDRAGLHTEAGGRSCSGASPHTEARGGSHDRAGPYMEAGCRSCNGTDPHKKAGAESHNGAGPHLKVEDGCCHGAGPIVEPEGGPDHGAGFTSEKQVKQYYGAGQRKRSQGRENNVGRDGVFTNLTALQHWGIQFGEESAPEKTGLSATHRCSWWEHSSPTWLAHSSPVIVPHPTGLVTMTTIAGAISAQHQDEQEPEEAGDDFGTFEKAGNHVVWAESVCPLWLEGEEPFSQNELTTLGTKGAGEGAAHHRTWRPWPKNSRETVRHAASLDGSSARAVGSWESKTPHLSNTLTPGGDWRPFHSISQDSSLSSCSRNVRGQVKDGDGEQWWSTSSLEGSAFPVAAPPKSSLGKKRLESVFHSCFPSVTSIRSTGDTFPTLEQILGSTGERGDDGLLSRPACELWSLIQDIDAVVSLKHKQTGCWSHRLLLASLHIDPGDANLPAVHATTQASLSQPSRDKRLELSRSPAVSGWESRELSVTKHSFPQYQMNGFSPSHRIQAFFHQWTQTERDRRSKTLHDASRNFAD